MRAAVFFLSIFFSPGVFSQTVHGIYFIANAENSTELAAAFQHDLAVMRNTFATISANLNYHYAEHLFSETNFKGANFDNFHSDVHSKSDDIICVYISSHGARNSYDQNPFPQILFRSNEGHSPLRAFIALKKIPHRTILFIIDACNGNREDLIAISNTAEEREVFEKSFPEISPVTVTRLKQSNIRRMFVDNCFDAIITSSEPGKKSFIFKKNGSLFTNNLYSSLINTWSSNNRYKIEDALLVTGEATYHSSLEIENKNPRTRKAYNPYGRIYNCSNPNESKDIPFNSSSYTELVIKCTRTKVKNTANEYELRLKMEGEESELAQIKEVRYMVSPNNTSEPIKVVFNRQNSYECSFRVEGDPFVTAVVTNNNGVQKTVAQEHNHTHYYHWY